MLHRFTHRAHEDVGLTRIELQVAILIVGIIVAMATPTFLGRRAGGDDAQAEHVARTAQTAMQRYATDHSGSYRGASVAGLERITPALSATRSGTLTAASPDTLDAGYTVTAKSSDGNTFSIIRGDDGAITRSCTAPSPDSGDCVGGRW